MPTVMAFISVVGGIAVFGASGLILGPVTLTITTVLLEIGLAIHSTRLFQTGWFVESLLTQTVIIHIIRTNRIPFLQSWPSWPLLLMSTLIISISIAIPFTSLGSYLGFVTLPPPYWLLLAISMLCYVVVTQLVKIWLLKRRWI